LEIFCSMASTLQNLINVTKQVKLKEQDFEDLFEPISKEELEKRYKKHIKRLGPLINERDLESIVQELKNLGYNVKGRLVFILNVGYSSTVQIFRALNIEDRPGAELVISVTADMDSDIYKNLGVKPLRPFFAEQGFEVKSLQHDTYKTKKEGIRRKRIVVMITKKKD